MAAEKETLQAGVGELAATVRDLAASLGSIENQQEFLLAAQKLGAIAGAIIDFEQSLPGRIPAAAAEIIDDDIWSRVWQQPSVTNTSESLQAEAADNSPALGVPLLPPAQTKELERDEADTEADVPVSGALPESPTGPELSAPLVEAKTRGPKSDFSEREQQLIDFLEAHSGQKMSPAALIKQISGPTINARRFVFNRTINKLRLLPEYQDRLMFEGSRSSRRYWLLPPGEVPEPSSGAPAEEPLVGAVYEASGDTPRPAGFHKLTPREQQLLDFLEDHIGKVFAPADLIDHIDAPTAGARHQAFQAFVKKLQSMPEYATRLISDGQTSDRRYWLRPAQETAETNSSNDADSDTEPVELTGAEQEAPVAAPQPVDGSPSAPPVPTPPFAHMQKRQLTDWGLTVSQNGHRRVLLGDRPLSLNETSIEVLEEIATHEAGVSFDELRRLLSEKRGHELQQPDLMRALAQITHEIGDDDTARWSDEITGMDDEDAEPDRILRLGGLLVDVSTEVSADFLARGQV